MADSSALPGAKPDACTVAAFAASCQVSFLAAQTWLSWSKKYYRALKTIHFDGARMDKLTYAALKSLGVDLSGVTLI